MPLVKCEDKWKFNSFPSATPVQINCTRFQTSWRASMCYRGTAGPVSPHLLNGFCDPSLVWKWISRKVPNPGHPCKKHLSSKQPRGHVCPLGSGKWWERLPPDRAMLLPNMDFLKWHKSPLPADLVQDQSHVPNIFFVIKWIFGWLWCTLLLSHQ